jgi:hypothetical protein
MAGSGTVSLICEGSRANLPRLGAATHGDPEPSTVAALRHTDAGRADGRRFANTTARLRGAAAGLRRELVTRHWKLGIPAGNRVALCGGDR